MPLGESVELSSPLGSVGILVGRTRDSIGGIDLEGGRPIAADIIDDDGIQMADEVRVVTEGSSVPKGWGGPFVCGCPGPVVYGPSSEVMAGVVSTVDVGCLSG